LHAGDISGRAFLLPPFLQKEMQERYGEQIKNDIAKQYK
jgi:hypothetical protein